MIRSLFPRLAIRIFTVAIFFAMPVLLVAEPLKIANDFYNVTVDAAAGSLSVGAKLSGKTFFTGGKLGAGGGAAKVVAATDKFFGNGQSIEIAYANGNSDIVTLYSEMPFVAFRSVIHNGTATAVALNHVAGISGTVELGKPVAGLRTLGTGGLLEPGKNPGSYAFLAVVDSAARNGVVGGWLTHDRGSGVVFSPVENDKVALQSRIDYGCLRIAPGSEATTETFLLGYFADARFGLEAYAAAMAKYYSVKIRPKQPGFCTWYTEKHSAACDEKFLPELSAYAATNLSAYGFGFVQIDDHWQAGISKNGPKKNFTTHDPTGPYPGGMKKTAENISALGLTPGIWFMPFAGTWEDPFFKDHQDWFVKTLDGKPYETAWGGTCLDLTQPAAQEYVRSVVARITHEWGYRLLKMDGFWTGSATKQIYVNNGYKEDGIGDAVFSNPNKPNIEAMRDGVKLVRATAGPDVFLLGCCVSQNMRSLSGSLGLLDAMRVGPDTGAGTIGFPHATRLWFLNGRVWWNDPDCVSVRATVPLAQAQLNASFAAISDTLFYNSDWMPDFPSDRLNILRRCIPGHGLFARPVDVFESENARIWHLPDTRGSVRRDVVAFFNYQNSPAKISDTAANLGLPVAEEYVGFDFWANKFVPPFKPTLTADLPPRSCRVFAIRPVSANPQLISTSRHLTQGMVDVTNEIWNATARTLSATSRVVGNDPYELRLVVPTGGKSWRITGLTVSPADAATGVKTEFKQDGPRIRATLTSEKNREVKWTATFEPATVNSAAPKPVANLAAKVDYRQITLSWDDNGAELYRVTDGDGKVFQTPATSFVDSQFSRNKTISYRVETIGWDGQVSATATVEATPLKALVSPPAPPLPDVELGSLKLSLGKNAHGKISLNKNSGGKPLRLGGKNYDKGFGVSAPAQIDSPIPAGAKRFVAVVGIDDAARGSAEAKFTAEIYGDVNEMGEKPVLLAQSPELSRDTIQAWSFNLELDSRFKKLQLVVNAGGKGKNNWADWVNAGFMVAK